MSKELGLYYPSFPGVFCQIKIYYRKKKKQVNSTIYRLSDERHFPPILSTKKSFAAERESYSCVAMCLSSIFFTSFLTRPHPFRLLELHPNVTWLAFLKESTRADWTRLLELTSRFDPAKVRLSLFLYIYIYINLYIITFPRI